MRRIDLPYVRADLVDLRGAERAARNLERDHLGFGEQLAGRAVEIDIAERADFGDA